MVYYTFLAGLGVAGLLAFGIASFMSGSVKWDVNIQQRRYTC